MDDGVPTQIRRFNLGIAAMSVNNSGNGHGSIAGLGRNVGRQKFRSGSGLIDIDIPSLIRNCSSITAQEACRY